MRYVPIIICIALAGCASEADLKATVSQASNFQLCRAIILAPANVAAIANEEAARRSLDCRPMVSAILQNEQVNNAAANEAAMRLLQPPPPPRNSMTRCSSYRIGNTMQTDCR